MKPVSLFAMLVGIDETTSDRAQRCMRGARTIYTIAKVGRSALSKANVYTAYVDAAISVLDAIESYARYRQALEITAQLRAEGDMLRVRLEELSKRIDIQKDTDRKEREAKTAALERRIIESNESIRIDLAYYRGCREQVRQVGAAMEKLREQSAPGCLHLQDIEAKYYHLVKAQIDAAVFLFDE